MINSESDNKLAGRHVPPHLRSYGVSSYGALLQHPSGYQSDEETFLVQEEGVGDDVRPSSSPRVHGGKLFRAVGVMGVLLVFTAAVSTAYSRRNNYGDWQAKSGGVWYMENGVDDMLAEVRILYRSVGYWCIYYSVLSV